MVPHTIRTWHHLNCVTWLWNIQATVVQTVDLPTDCDYIWFCVVLLPSVRQYFPLDIYQILQFLYGLKKNKNCFNSTFLLHSFCTTRLKVAKGSSMSTVKYGSMWAHLVASHVPWVDYCTPVNKPVLSLSVQSVACRLLTSRLYVREFSKIAPDT